MMIPPLVRVGPPPDMATDNGRTIVVLTRHGWRMAIYDFSTNALRDIHPHVKPEYRTIWLSDVLCWMPADGS